MSITAFNMEDGHRAVRKTLIAMLNTGTSSAPVWSPVGVGVESSDIEMDWGTETATDILDNVRTTMSTPTVTQSFDPWPLAGGDAAQFHLWNLAVVKQDRVALCNQDCLIIHKYAGSAESGFFAERYPACAFPMNRHGGDGGKYITSGYTVTYGGERVTGTAKFSQDGGVTFTPDAG